MAAAYEHHFASIREILLSLAENLHQNPEIPITKFTIHPQKVGKCKFAYPYAANDHDLRFKGYYGDMEIGTLGPGKRAVSVVKSVPFSPPREELFKSIRQHVTDCIDSVAPDDLGNATVSIFLSKIFFHVNNRTFNEDERKFLKHGATFNGQFEVTPPDCKPIKVVRNRCDHGSPAAFIQFLRECGVEILSRETLPDVVKLNLHGMCMDITLDSQKYFFDNCILLNSDTLSFEKWSIQCWYPMNYYVIKAETCSNDVVLRVKLGRSLSLDDLKKTKQNIPRLLTEPNLDDWLRKDDVAFFGASQDRNVKKIIEFYNQEQIHLRFMNVYFHLHIHSLKVYQFDRETLKFDCCDDITVAPTLVFNFLDDRSELIETVTTLLLKLLDAGDTCEELNLRTPETFVHEPGGKRLPCKDIQALLRLRFEFGPLLHLLGLPNGTQRQECRRKAIEIKELILSCWTDTWVIRMRLDLEKLLMKLKKVAAREGINLDR